METGNTATTALAVPEAPAGERTMRTIFHGAQNNKGLFMQGAAVKRVAAYCRVSTMLDTQATSLETQMSIFRQRILERPGWELVDVYADEGLSGTSAKNRREFQRMIADCEAGKIDYIITKSISRFARNTLECLSYVRHLQSLGVQLLFEKENLDTGSALSEMLLTVLAAFAQEESYSISQNIRWGIRREFEAGRTRWHPIYGYRCGIDGSWVIEETEAAVVRQIYSLYEHGMSLRQIAKQLNDEGILTARGNPWGNMAVRHMLKNEKYKGDAELQKTCTVDLLTHKKVRNNATEVPRYYISNHHQAIVSPDTYDRVQKIAAMKDSTGGKMPSYPYGCMDLRCPLCGSPLVPINTRGFGNKQMAYGCFAKGGCGEFALRKHCLNQAVLLGYRGVTLEALRTLGRADAEAARFLCFKEKTPDMAEVEFYWLDVLVQRLELHRLTNRKVRNQERSAWAVAIFWRCGLESIIPIDFRRYENDPFSVAALHRQHQEEQRNNAHSTEDGTA